MTFSCRASLIGVLGLLILCGAASIRAEAQPPNANDDKRAYRLAPFDVLDIKVTGEQGYQVQMPIDADGTIQFPNLPSMKIIGLNRDEASAKIASQLKAAKLLNDAQVLVSVVSFGQQAYIQGNVGTPGALPLTRDTHLRDLLARAGGVRGDTAADLILTRRGQPDQKIPIKALVEGTDPSLDVLIQDGDTITVPEAPYYYLTGSVNRPGRYPILPDMTIEQAIAQGGGVLPTGDEDRLILTRINDQHKAEEVDDVKRIDPVMPHDTIRVRESLF